MATSLFAAPVSCVHAEDLSVVAGRCPLTPSAYGHQPSALAPRQASAGRKPLSLPTTPAPPLRLPSTDRRNSCSVVDRVTLELSNWAIGLNAFLVGAANGIRFAFEGIVAIWILAAQEQDQRSGQISGKEERAPVLVLADVDQLVPATALAVLVGPVENNVTEGDGAGAAGHKWRVAEQRGEDPAPEFKCWPASPHSAAGRDADQSDERADQAVGCSPNEYQCETDSAPAHAVACLKRSMRKRRGSDELCRVRRYRFALACKYSRNCP